jgi:hypothetical protein
MRRGLLQNETSATEPEGQLTECVVSEALSVPAQASNGLTEYRMPRSSLPKMQIKAFPGMLKKLFKAKALDEDKMVREVYDEALVEFFGERKIALKQKEKDGRPLTYLVPDGDITLDVELKPERAKALDRFAEETDKSKSIIVYTALMEYAEKNKLAKK